MQRKLDLISCETTKLRILKEDQASQRVTIDKEIMEAQEKKKKEEKKEKLQQYKDRREEEDREEAAQMARTKNLVASMHQSIGDTDNINVNSSIVNVLGNFQGKKLDLKWM